MQEGRSNKMVQRRVIYFLIRGILFILACILLWRMVTLIRNPELSDVNREIQNYKSTSDNVLVEVFYESMCPDSKHFIRHQLVPVLEKIPEIVNFRLIPYGKAKTLENATGIFFICQHLEQECLGNKIHACGIKYITERSIQLNFVSCLINNIRDPFSAGKSCAAEANVRNWDEIEECYTTKEGSELLKGYGEETHNLNPSVTFIPTILINKSQGHQTNILKNLLKEVCSKFSGTKPQSCL